MTSLSGSLFFQNHAVDHGLELQQDFALLASRRKDDTVQCQDPVVCLIKDAEADKRTPTDAPHGFEQAMGFDAVLFVD